MSVFLSTNYQPDMDLQTAVQVALDAQKLETLIQEESSGTYVPVVIVTNGTMPTDLSLTMFDQTVKLVEEKKDVPLIKKEHPYLYMLKCDIREKRGRAELEMVYNDAKVTIKLVKEEGQWMFKSFASKQKSKRSFELEF